MIWARALAALERAHPCLCGDDIRRKDEQRGEDWLARVRSHLASCPKRKLLDVLCAMRHELPEDAYDEG